MLDRNLENVLLRGRRMSVNRFGLPISQIHRLIDSALSPEFLHSLSSEETDLGVALPIVAYYVDTSVLETGKSQASPTNQQRFHLRCDLMKCRHRHPTFNRRKFFNDSSKSRQRIFNPPLLVATLFNCKCISHRRQELGYKLRPKTREIVSCYPSY